MRHFDVVIIGAGPAGAATALALRKNHPYLSVLILEASEFQNPRPAETLTPDAIPLLQQLEVFDFFLEQNHRTVTRHASAWGSCDATTRLFDGREADNGWFIDRARFDSMLAGYAAASGVSFIRATLTKVQMTSNGSWQLTAQSASVTHILGASFVVDASGRGARFASEIGVAQIAQDTLVGVVRTVELERDDQTGPGCLIEAFEHGWWYSAPIDSRRLAITVMTDADISKRLQLTQLAEWSEQLEKAPQTNARVAGLAGHGELCVRAAHTRNLTCCTGNNWLAVGDAAASIDPLASQGILRALRFGLHAGSAIGAQFKSRLPDLKSYEQLVRAEFENNLALRMEDYRAEQRWNSAPFWARRHAAANVLPSTGREKKMTLRLNPRAPHPSSSVRAR
jgi:flavin-dependent dehydrogenase